MADEAWDVFRKTLNHELSERSPRLSASQFERRLRGAGVEASEERISNWRRGRARPKLNELRGIVDALNEDRRDNRPEPFTLAKLLTDMNILPPSVPDEDLFGRAYRLTKLNQKLQDAETAMASAGKRAGAARIVQEAMLTGEWAVAVTPAVEGPDPDTQMHVADRLTICRMRGEVVSADPKADIWADERMKSAIRATYALPSGAGYRWESPPADAVAAPTSWSISYVTSPRDAVVSVPWQGLRSLAFVATTQTSWVKNVASLVSLALGYGLTTTSDLAMAESGRAIDETTHAAREQAHEFFLHRLPARRAWAHYGIPSEGHSVFRVPAGETPPHFVFLEENDALLANAPREGSLEQLKLARQRVAAEAQLDPVHVLVLPCELRASRSEKWVQVFEQALRTLQWLGASTSGVSFAEERLRSAHEQVRLREGGVAIPFLRWLDRQDWRARPNA